jgi:hypothetical protein
MQHHPQFSDRERFNWGYWDGRHDAERGRMPLWKRGAHPWPVYEAGYWYGRDDESPPTTSDSAWADYQDALNQTGEYAAA